MNLTPEQADQYLDSIKLRAGKGEGRDDVCVMQAAEYIATGGNSDRPDCASQVITDFLISLNDRLGDDNRQKLKPFARKILNTRDTDEQEDRRRYLMRDWSVRKFAPTWFELAGFVEAAETLRSLPEVVDKDTKKAAVKTLQDLCNECFGDSSVSWLGWRSRLHDRVYVAVKLAVKEKKSVIAAIAAIATTTTTDDAIAAAIAAAAVASTISFVATSTEAAVYAIDDAIADAAAAIATTDIATTAAAAWYKYGSPAYCEFRRQVYEQVRALFDQAFAPAIDRNMPLVAELLEAMIAVTADKQ